MPIIPGAVVVPANVDDLNITLEGARTLAQLYVYDSAGGNWDRARGTTTAGLLVDTELPAAGLLGDALATPTTPMIGSNLLVYNGATWDMVREGSVAGSVLTDVVDRAARDLGKVDVAAFDTAITPADAAATPTTSPPVASFNMGYNGATWDRLRSSIANGLEVDVTQVQGTVTVDTELPAAAALADDVANPTVPAVGAFGMVWDGATWDRMPGTSADGVLVNLGANNDIFIVDNAAGARVGNPSADGLSSGLSLFTRTHLLGFNGATWDRLRSSVANGLEVDVTQVQGTVTVDSELAAAAALTDNFATPTTAPIGAFGMMYDGAAWDMVRGDATDGLLVNLGANNDVDTELPAAAALSDAFANPTAPAVGAMSMVWDGGNWARLHSGNVDGFGGALFAGVVPMLYDGAVNDRQRSVEIGDGVAATGIAAAGLMAYNGTTFDLVRTAAASGEGLGSIKVHKQNEHNVTVRAASGALTTGETTTPVTGLGAYRLAVIRLDVTTITTPDGDDEVDFYIQTSYNGGTDWADVENVHFDNADNGNTAIKLIIIGDPQTSAVARDETDGSLADDTKNDIPLGDRLRIKTVVAGASAPTYAYNAEASFKS